MQRFTVQVIDADGVFHGYVQLARSRAEVEESAWTRFGELRLLSVRRAA